MATTFKTQIAKLNENKKGVSLNIEQQEENRIFVEISVGTDILFMIPNYIEISYLYVSEYGTRIHGTVAKKEMGMFLKSYEHRLTFLQEKSN